MRVLTWNGKTVPAELKKLPPGRYALESVDEVPILSPEQEDGIEEALASLRRGEGLPSDAVHARIAKSLRKQPRATRRRK